MADLLLTKFVYLNLYLFVSINHVQTSVLRLGGGNSERTLHNGGWIILRCENYSFMWDPCNFYHVYRL